MLEQLYRPFQHWSKDGAVWIYSDPHFNDKDLADGIKRPSAEDQVRMINSMVGRKDTLIILGDIGDIEMVRKLRGYKVLIMGNHDAGASNYRREIISKKFDKDKYSYEQIKEMMLKEYPSYRISISEGYDLVHAPFVYYYVQIDNQLFDEVYEGPLFVSEKLLLTHEPVEIPFAFNIHGHDHSGKKFQDGKHLNVCSDVIGYMPVSLNQFFKSGRMAKVVPIHRITIDDATKRKKKRGGKKIAN